MSGIISAPQFFETFPNVDPANSNDEHAATMQGGRALESTCLLLARLTSSQ